MTYENAYSDADARDEEDRQYRLRRVAERQARLAARRAERDALDEVLPADSPFVTRCLERLTDHDGFAARCWAVAGTEHSHHDYTAREAVTRGLALAV